MCFWDFLDVYTRVIYSVFQDMCFWVFWGYMGDTYIQYGYSTGYTDKSIRMHTEQISNTDSKIDKMLKRVVIQENAQKGQITDSLKITW